MNLLIRQATVDDALDIAALSRQTFYDTFAEFNSKEDMDKFMNDSFSMEKLVEECNDPRHVFFAATLNNKLVGYAKITNSENPDQLANVNAIELGRLYAAKESIGHGVGKALMATCIETAGLRNKEWIWLGVWEKNERAITFYKKFGFEKFGEHDFVLGDDVQTDWLMKKKI